MLLDAIDTKGKSPFGTGGIATKIEAAVLYPRLLLRQPLGPHRGLRRTGGQQRPPHRHRPQDGLHRRDRQVEGGRQAARRLVLRGAHRLRVLLPGRHRLPGQGQDGEGVVL